MAAEDHFGSPKEEESDNSLVAAEWCMSMEILGMSVNRKCKSQVAKWSKKGGAGAWRLVDDGHLKVGERVDADRVHLKRGDGNKR